MLDANGAAVQQGVEHPSNGLVLDMLPPHMPLVCGWRY
jgi:hypothetical protein